MRHTILTVPGYHGSGAGHWQSWLEGELPEARRVGGIDWEDPLLARWAGEVRREIDEAPGAVWIVAHSFGCLASVVAAADRPQKVGGLLLVAPADPERFDPLGLRADAGQGLSLADYLPQTAFDCPSILVASRSDPWLRMPAARTWAERWGSRLIDVGDAGHINTDSGYGPWPQALELLAQLRAAADTTLGAISSRKQARRGRMGALARLRHQTRRLINSEARVPGRP
ncbi:RBBP9/YdeN family alpha/beta hydrolase [Thauera sp.]|uniref:RBBP9/YdeN family alpha/beta hydrolase n=1 Tax=Thauera sp. TaxID=1905334 RepID=UPI0039E234D5